MSGQRIVRVWNRRLYIPSLRMSVMRGTVIPVTVWSFRADQALATVRPKMKQSYTNRASHADANPGIHFSFIEWGIQIKKLTDGARMRERLVNFRSWADQKHVRYFWKSNMTPTAYWWRGAFLSEHGPLKWSDVASYKFKSKTYQADSCQNKPASEQKPQDSRRSSVEGIRPQRKKSLELISTGNERSELQRTANNNLLYNK